MLMNKNFTLQHGFRFSLSLELVSSTILSFSCFIRLSW